MYHLNRETGEPGKCSAQPGNCPFGGEDNHFASKDDARTAYEDSQTLFAPPQRLSVKDKLDQAEANLRQAIQEGENLEAAKHRWQEASLAYAATPEGQQHYTERADGAGRAAEAARYFQLEGARRMVQAFDEDDLLDAMGAPEASSIPSKEIQKPTPTPAILWPVLDRDLTVGSSSSTVKDLAQYQEAFDDFIRDENQADAETIRKMRPGFRAFSKLKYYAAPYKRTEANHRVTYSQPFEPEEWQERLKENDKYLKQVASRVLDHPAAADNDFVTVGVNVDEGLAFNHPKISLAAREALVAAWGNERRIPEEVLPNAREFRPASNRLALYLSANDSDSFHRAEAFNQVVMSEMQTYTEEDRAWMAKNMDKFPTNEGTVETLKTSLRMWAKGYADQEERERLLALLPEELPVPAEEPRRGLFGRRRPAEISS